jgi:hypothetical protein
MTVKSRIAGLERRMGVCGGRRLCRCSGAKANVAFQWPEEPKPKLEERVCPACGGIQKPLLIRVRYDDESESNP